ncbi:hypothetical protein [Terrarubrum flagellatum]|uniref:hypothetical protein n=1 Tax=Terrirubrum flagellatum TaxID=2895980 RepID=UPI003144F765
MGASRAQTVATVTPPQQEATATADPCLAPGGAEAAISEVTEFGDLKLSDGRLGRLADLDLGVDSIAAGRWPAHVSAIRQVLSGLHGKVDEAGAFPDRWGRLPLRISVVAEGNAARSAHALLVEKGLARIWPLGEQDSCAGSLLKIESEARQKALGLWREPGSRLLKSDEIAAIQAMAGRFVIIEGRVVSVGERPRRIYLNFGRDFRRDFTATLSPRTAKLLEKAGITPSSLRGQIIRVRGMVAARRAPAIEITSAGQLEVVR